MSESTTQDPRPGTLYIAWNSFQRRQVAMAPIVGFECVFLPLPPTKGSRLRQAGAWVVLFMRTMRLLRKARPAELWMQLPHVPLLWAGLLYRSLFDSKLRLVADCHNAMFVAPWSRVPFGLSALGHCGCVLVHNAAVLDQALGFGVPANRVRVLEDVPPSVDASRARAPTPAWLASRPRPWVLFPASFAGDEPIAEVLEAARMMPETSFVITGNTANAARRGHLLDELPANVLISGFLPVATFDALLGAADVVLALTRFEGIQLSVCNEALGFAKPMVMSDTQVLRALFSEAAVLVKGSPRDIAEGVRVALADTERLAAASATLAAKRRSAWKLCLQAAMHPGAAPNGPDRGQP